MSHFKEAESYEADRKSASFPFNLSALLSFWDLFSSVAFVLICLDLNTLSFFHSPSSLFIANSNGANVVCHRPDPLCAAHTTGTSLLVSRTSRR